jgi:Ca2+-binding EF-hand superfamily protein
MSVVAALGLATTLGLGGQGLARDTGQKFDEMDANGDGKVSEAEHSAWAGQKFTRMDTNGDGKVTAAEMSAEKDRSGKAGGKQMSAEEKIRTIDTNGDGSLSKEEHEAGTVAKFTEMDANKDGSLSKTELKSGHDKMKTDKTKAQRTDTTDRTDMK